MNKSFKDQSKQTSDNLQAKQPDDSNNQIVNTFIEGAEGTDRPMEESHPYAPAIITFATYPIILGLVIFGGLTYWYFFL